MSAIRARPMSAIRARLKELFSNFGPEYESNYNPDAYTIIASLKDHMYNALYGIELVNADDYRNSINKYFNDLVNYDHITCTPFYLQILTDLYPHRGRLNDLNHDYIHGVIHNLSKAIDHCDYSERVKQFLVDNFFDNFDILESRHRRFPRFHSLTGNVQIYNEIKRRVANIIEDEVITFEKAKERLTRLHNHLQRYAEHIDADIRPINEQLPAARRPLPSRLNTDTTSLRSQRQHQDVTTARRSSANQARDQLNATTARRSSPSRLNVGTMSRQQRHVITDARRLSTNQSRQSHSPRRQQQQQPAATVTRRSRSLRQNTAERESQPYYPEPDSITQQTDKCMASIGDLGWPSLLSACKQIQSDLESKPSTFRMNAIMSNILQNNILEPMYIGVFENLPLLHPPQSFASNSWFFNLQKPLLQQVYPLLFNTQNKLRNINNIKIYATNGDEPLCAQGKGVAKMVFDKLLEQVNENGIFFAKISDSNDRFDINPNLLDLIHYLNDNQYNIYDENDINKYYELIGNTMAFCIANKIPPALKLSFRLLISLIYPDLRTIPQHDKVIYCMLDDPEMLSGLFNWQRESNNDRDISEYFQYLDDYDRMFTNEQGQRVEANANNLKEFIVDKAGKHLFYDKNKLQSDMRQSFVNGFRQWIDLNTPNGTKITLRELDELMGHEQFTKEKIHEWLVNSRIKPVNSNLQPINSQQLPRDDRVKFESAVAWLKDLMMHEDTGPDFTKQLIFFCTGLRKLDFEVGFNILFSADRPQSLPRSATCFNLLILPEYLIESEILFKEKITFAITGSENILGRV